MIRRSRAEVWTLFQVVSGVESFIVLSPPTFKLLFEGCNKQSKVAQIVLGVLNHPEYEFWMVQIYVFHLEA